MLTKRIVRFLLELIKNDEYCTSELFNMSCDKCPIQNILYTKYPDLGESCPRNVSKYEAIKLLSSPKYEKIIFEIKL